jgi:hypothetical protein
MTNLTVTTPQVPALELLVSLSKKRTNPVALNGTEFDVDQLAIFLVDVGDIAYVDFLVTNTTTGWSAQARQTSAPFDLAGTRANGDAVRVDTANLDEGRYVVVAEVMYRGQTFVTSAEFTVNH